MSGFVGRVDDAGQVDRRMLVDEDVSAAEDFRERLCKGGAGHKCNEYRAFHLLGSSKDV